MRPESAATELLAALPAYLWDGQSLPVPVEDIADTYFGLHVREQDDLSAVPGAPAELELSGMLLVDSREIWVNAAEARDWPGRRRFTIGHELGHWCLHRTPGGAVFCRASAQSLEIPEAATPDIEEEASLFAGALLFPPPLVRAEHERVGGDLAVLRERFGASNVATERAVFRILSEPAVRAVAPGLACFFWDDDAYDAYREEHPDAYVVNDDLGDPERGRLHRLTCTYMNRDVRPGQPPRTRSPKWCDDDAGLLLAAFPHAQPCRVCAKSRVAGRPSG